MTICDELWVAGNSASKGGVPGQILPGEWRGMIFMRRLPQSLDCTLEVNLEFEPDLTFTTITFPENIVISAKPGWYKGELHSHSDHSTGRTGLPAVIQTAREHAYDFLAVTDHLTVSHWNEMAALIDQQRPVMIRGMEISGSYGHTNALGISKWIDPFVDRPDWGMSQVADLVHRQRGLFCINHAMGGKAGWRYDTFDWNQADLFEIYCIPDGPNNNLYPLIWDRHLSAGSKLVGVASSDSHHPTQGPLWALGQIVNWVYADELSERGLIDGLARGRVYASRGPEMRFTARNQAGQHAEMWESLPLDGQEIRFNVQLNLSEAASLFVIKNGYLFDDWHVEPSSSREWQTIEFTDRPEMPSYYRIEVYRYRKDEVYRYITWRDFETMLVISNPIWIGQQ